VRQVHDGGARLEDPAPAGSRDELIEIGPPGDGQGGRVVPWPALAIRAEVLARGWTAATSGEFRVEERKNGRGERTSADTPSPIRLTR
jgi:hypothetical protein